MADGGKCVDVNCSDGARVQLSTCNGSGAQNWSVLPDGTQLIIWSCAGGANQKWTLSQEAKR
jgi:cytochrome c